MDIVLSICVTIILTIINGFFSCSEMALVNARRAILELEAEEGDQKSQKTLQLLSDTTQMFATIQVAITLVGFFASAFAATSLSEPLAEFLQSLHVPYTRVIAPVVITLVVSYFSIVVGELLPKRIALAYAEPVSKHVVGFLQAFMWLARPVVWVTSWTAEKLSNLFGITALTERQQVTEEEIRYLVTDTPELSEEEKTMIHEIFNLGDTIAREVMIPRVDMKAMPDSSSCQAVLDVMIRTGYSRIPIYHTDVDTIKGVAHIKDLIVPSNEGKDMSINISEYMREATYVPDSKDIIPLLSEMQSSHEQMVIVVDEYGGTAGIITIEDIVEQVMGEIEDEFDPDNKYLTKLNTHEWLVDGRYSIDDAIELGWPVVDSEGFETIAGFVIDLADKLPKPGDAFYVDGFRFKVQSMRGNRVTMLRVSELHTLESESYE